MTSMKILIVDDSITIRRIISTALKTVGYSETVEAANGKEALAKLENGNVDFIITDWNMPEMTGIEFIRSVRSDGKNAKLPVLMVTTNAAKDDIVEALRAGVTNYVVKPFTPDTMKEKIEAVLAG